MGDELPEPAGHVNGTATTAAPGTTYTGAIILTIA
jgi:hypothetical protein